MAATGIYRLFYIEKSDKQQFASLSRINQSYQQLCVIIDRLTVTRWCRTKDLLWDHKLQWPQEGLNCEPFTLIHQPAFTCSNWVMETPKNCGKSILVSLLLILNRFHTLFWYFHCWLWTNKCRLRQFPDQLCLLSIINHEHGPALIWNEGSIPKIAWHF